MGCGTSSAPAPGAKIEKFPQTLPQPEVKEQTKTADTGGAPILLAAATKQYNGKVWTDAGRARGNITVETQGEVIINPSTFSEQDHKGA